MARIFVDGRQFGVSDGAKVLDAVRGIGVYVPSLCSHPALPDVRSCTSGKQVWRGDARFEAAADLAAQWDGCGLCAVEVDGSLVRSCEHEVTDGMAITTSSSEVLAWRRQRLADLLAAHPHACLTCAQSEGCPRTQCSSNVPLDERCCELFGSCELERVARFVGIPSTVPRYRPRGIPELSAEPLYRWRPELCVGCVRCVRACEDLRGVGALSFVMIEGRPVVGTACGPTRAESHCRFCGACVEVCPTGALIDRNRAASAGRERALVPCRDACPAGVDIPRLLRHVASGESQKAAAVIREKVPLAFAASYVCFHPCEEACRRGDVNAPVSICRLKRFAMGEDGAASHMRRDPPAPTGKRVAVIGSGPAGLTAAYYLAREGHGVTVHEALPRPGGMLLVGIPEYRFPRELLERDVGTVRAAGVEIRCNSPITAADMEKLRGEYDAVFLATGAHAAKRIHIHGDDLDGVYWGVDFLRTRALGQLAADHFASRRVVVVGGGNVALDAARVARRLGAVAVQIVSLEAAGDLPAWKWEIGEAGEEGIGFLPAWGPARVIGSEGKVSGLVVKRCTRVFDADRRFNPAYDEKTTRELPAEAVIFAIGQEARSELSRTCGIGPPQPAGSLATAIPKVFAGGDVVTGPRSVIEAVAMGRRAASEIDRALGGDGDIEERLVDEDPIEHRLGRIDGFAWLARAEPVRSAPSSRETTFCAIEETFDVEVAELEARRCLSCDLRLAIPSAPLAPRHEALVELTAQAVEGVPESEGVYQLLDADGRVVAIKGVMNLRAALVEAMAENSKARSFVFEIEPMYTKRESELLQQYLQEHGELPAGADDLDDLF